MPARRRRRRAAAEPCASRRRRSRPCARRRRRAPSRGERCDAVAARVARCRPSWRRTSRRASRPSPPTAARPRRCRRCRRTGPCPAPHRPAPCRAAIAASTRGSSCATSAITRRQPGSARTAARSWRGSCSAPPPDDAHRPVTTPPGHVHGPEPAVVDPLGEPRPPVGRQQPGELLVLEQRLDDRMPVLGELPSARGLDEHAGAVQRAQQLGLRVEARGGVAQRLAHAPAGVLELRRGDRRRRVARRAHRVRMRLVRRGIPRQPGGAQLDRDQRARGLGRRQQPEASRIG